jgi:hypothetical protein
MDPSLLTSSPTGDLSRLGNGERNLAESKGPRGPSARARASQFTTADVYAFERELEKLHPDNQVGSGVRGLGSRETRLVTSTPTIERGIWRLP